MSTTALDRQVRRRLAILLHAEEVTGNVAMTCRYYGITRQSFYVWKRRYDELGEDGLKDRSRRPKTCPNATHVDVVGKIIYLRQNYHFGPAKISMYLKRYHDVDISSSGVWRILKRLEFNRLPSSQRYKRLEQALAALREAATRPSGPDRRQVHRPIKGPSPSATTSSPPSTTAPDCACCASTHDSTRRPPSSSPTTSSSACHSRVQVIQTDNGSEFGPMFHYHVLDKGVGHRYIKPRTPRLNGKVERSHRIDAEEFYRLLDGTVIDDAKVFNHKLARVGGLLQLRPPPRRPRRPNSLRTATTKDTGSGVTGPRQLHTAPLGGFEPPAFGLEALRA